MREGVQERVGALLGVAVEQLRELPGGRSSITFGARLVDGRDVVVKVAPPGLPPVRNRDVLRQARILRGLAGVSGVAVPEVLGEDAGDPPLFVMTFVAGDSFEPVTSDVPLPAPGVVTRRAEAAATMLARLHAVDPHAAGLGDEPAVGLEDEVARWERALATLDGVGARDVADALRRSAPPPMPPAVSHGDWRLGNMISTGPGIAAVIDWEIWSIADPRLDLAWFVASSVFDGNVFATRDVPGMPPAAGLVDRYGPVSDLDWFSALVDFKQAATVGLIAKHNRKAGTPDVQFEQAVPLLLDRARGRLAVRGG